MLKSPTRSSRWQKPIYAPLNTVCPFFPVKENFLESLVMSMSQSFAVILLQGKKPLADQFRDSLLRRDIL